jgi:hemerythrin
MKLSEIRAELLREHSALRGVLREATAAAERWRAGDAARDELHGALGRLAEQVSAHNTHEEELLRDIIPTIDAWGKVRAETMLEEHSSEHAELHATLIEAGSTADVTVAVRAVFKLAERMDEHMSREEKSFLGDDVLRDEDGPPTDYFGG